MALPQDESLPPANPPPLHAPLQRLPRELIGARVLVCEDEPAWRRIIELDLTMMGYRVTLAETARQALEVAEPGRLDGAIVDVMLSDSDGVSVAYNLRKRHPDLPVILFTAYADQASLREWPGSVVGQISKSADMAELTSLLERAIRAAWLVSGRTPSARKRHRSRRHRRPADDGGTVPPGAEAAPA